MMHELERLQQALQLSCEEIALLKEENIRPQTAHARDRKALQKSQEEVAALKEENIQRQTAHARDIHALESMLQHSLEENARLTKVIDAANAASSWEDTRSA